MHLVAAGFNFGGTVGLSYIGGVCSFGGSGMYSFSLGAGAGCARASIMIHELGHSWGSNHTSSGIMSQFVTSDCNAPWVENSLTEIPAARDRVAGFCLDLANQPPQARFTFSCSALACSFDASGSTDDQGITGYAWTFGDGGSASGVTASHTFAASGTRTVTLTVTDANGATGTASRKVNAIAGSPAAAEGFFTVPLCRVYDSRNATILSSGVLRTLQVTGACGIPSTAKAVSVTVTAVSPTGAGFFSFYPGNLPPSPYADPTANLNFDPSIPARASNGVLALSTNGAGQLAALPAVAGSPGQVHLVVDVAGYFSEDLAPAPGAQGPFGFQVLAPCRAVDTRSGSPLSAGTPRSFTVKGVCGVPADATAAALNLAAVGPTVGGFVVLFPSDSALPPVSSLNFNAEPTSATANGARLRLAPSTPDMTAVYGTAGGSGTTHLVLDVAGYFKGGAPLLYHPVTPCREVDTRFAEMGAPALAGGQARSFQIRGNCGIPATAKAAVVGVTAIGPNETGFLTAWASGSPFPGTSTLNFDTAQGTIANGAIVPLSTSANDLSVIAGGSGTLAVHLTVDVFGYFE